MHLARLGAAGEGKIDAFALSDESRGLRVQARISIRVERSRGVQNSRLRQLAHSCVAISHRGGGEPFRANLDGAKPG